MLSILFAAENISSSSSIHVNPLVQIIPIIVVWIVVFYLVLFLPQKKKEKKRLQMLSSLKKNDQIITIGGIYGTIQSIKDNEVIIKVDDKTNTKIKILKSAISEVVESKEG